MTNSWNNNEEWKEKRDKENEKCLRMEKRREKPIKNKTKKTTTQGSVNKSPKLLFTKGDFVKYERIFQVFEKKVYM